MQIKYNNVSFSYNKKTNFEVKALNNINIEFNENKVYAIVGRTGSGKTTLSELINYLQVPQDGEVIVNNFINKTKVKHKNKEIMNLRKDIGYIFQFSEKQLFEETVIKDVSFGINNFYPKKEDYLKDVKQALNDVGLDESFYNRSPFDLSGGEKKRVAIAGILAYNPKLLILDEPTVGLDQNGKTEIMKLFMNIHNKGVPIILITHDMNLVLEYADEVIVLKDGEIVKNGNPKIILNEDVEKYNLDTPNLYKFIHILKKNKLNINDNNINNLDDLIKEIKYAKTHIR